MHLRLSKRTQTQALTACRLQGLFAGWTHTLDAYKHARTHAHDLTMTMRGRGAGAYLVLELWRFLLGVFETRGACVCIESILMSILLLLLSKERVATEGLTWGMKASTPHSNSVDTTTATALTIFVEGARGGEKDRSVACVRVCIRSWSERCDGWWCPNNAVGRKT